MAEYALQKTAANSERQRRLQVELNHARRELLETEAELTQEQAAVNAFRLQCRLKIGHLLDDYLELRAHKQTLWTRLQLLQQAQEFGIPYDEDDPFWHGRDPADLHDDLPADGLLPELGSHIRDRAAEKRLYRELARRFHPDLAATGVERAAMTAMMTAVNVAYKNQDIEALRDLADELDPAMAAELALLDTAELRLRTQILKAQRRERRAKQQLAALRRDHMTRLWHKAEQLEADGRVWWEEVRADLLALIARRQEEIAALQTAVTQLEKR